MLHKHSSAEKAQVYFGITEKLKHDAANFFIYIQPKLGQIYDNSVYRALGEHFNFQDVRGRHITHISTLLTGGIDHRFIEESHLLRKKYAELDVTPGEYIKLYQLIISYLSGEAHKKHWWRYKKYRDLNRSIRNLLLFDLAVATSPKEIESSLGSAARSQELYQSTLLIDPPLMFQTILEELSELLENSHAIINECHQILQSVLALTPTATVLSLKDKADQSSEEHPSLFDNDFDYEIDSLKMPSNQNQPALGEILSLTQKKIHQVSTIILMQPKDKSHQQIKDLEEMLNDIHEDIETISNMHVVQIPKNISVTGTSQETLHTLLQKSSAAIGSQLISLEELKERKFLIK